MARTRRSTRPAPTPQRIEQGRKHVGKLDVRSLFSSDNRKGYLGSYDCNERLFVSAGYGNKKWSDDEDDFDEEIEDEEEVIKKEWTGVFEFQTKPWILYSEKSKDETWMTPSTTTFREEWEKDIMLSARLLRSSFAVYDSSARYWPKELSVVENGNAIVGNYDLIFVGVICKCSDEISKLQRSGKLGTVSIKSAEERDVSFHLKFAPSFYKSGLNEDFLYPSFTEFNLVQGRTEEWNDDEKWFCISNGGEAKFCRVQQQGAVFPWIPNDWEVASSDYTTYATDQLWKDNYSWLCRHTPLTKDTVKLISEFIRNRPKPQFQVLPGDLWISFRGDDTVNEYDGILVARRCA
mmetsp:Transcript_39740/g.73259  ORF Transcript_39740/g.73259 Transcript_39740/m.73259 type:complete len:349 (-) Transcript_39740:441-1487(-)